MNTKELEQMFNVTAEEIDKWDEDACKGVLPGKPKGEVIFGPGRPMMFGERTQQVGFREPVSKVDIITKRAKILGVKRSDYLRNLVDADLRSVGMI
jgi:hypothetical protein